MKAFEVHGKYGDIHPVTDGLSLGFPHLFDVTSSTHVLAEQAGSRVIRHDQSFCLLFDVHGTVHVDCVATHVTLGPDEVFLLVPNGSALFTLSQEKGAEFYLVQFRRPLATKGNPRHLLKVPEHAALGNQGRLTHLMRMLMEESRKAGGSRVVLHHLLVLMLCEMVHSAQLPVVTKLHEDCLESIASRVDAYIAAHYHEPIGTPDIAGELRYNPDYLERAYRSERRISIRDAIHARRLREARAQLLLQRASAIAEVAVLCGYADAASFRRVFKRETSMTPHHYRVDQCVAAGRGGPPHQPMISFAVSDTISALNGGLFVSPGFGTHAQRVIDSYELIFVTQGCLDIFEGPRSFHLERNQSLLLYPGLRHGGLRPYPPDVNFYWAHFRVRQDGAHDSVVDVPKSATVRDPEGLTELFCRFISDQESGVLDPCSAAQLIALMLCLIAEGGADAPAPPSRGARKDQGGIVEAVHRYIDGEYRAPISTAGIAKALGFNPDYLERVFHDSAHISIIDALHQKRIGMAKAALHTNVRRNINEIAFECGYAEPSYFRRMFKRLTGLTPREFRSLYARTHINTH